MSDFTQAKLNIELNFVGDGRIFLNYWDSIHGKDVTAEFKPNENKLMLYLPETDTEKEINLFEFIADVELSYLETLKSK